MQRIQKTLEEANIKLDTVISDILGMNGRRMIEAIVAGVRDPRQLAALAERRLKATPKQLYDACMAGCAIITVCCCRSISRNGMPWMPPIREVDREAAARIAQFDGEEDAAQARFCAVIDRLSLMPGVSVLAARTILAEIGRDMSRFPTAGHLVAWAGLCPDQNESAGKKKSTPLRKGAPWLKTMLVQCAWAAKRKKGSYYQAQFFRLQSRRGPQKAIGAVAASLLTAIYHMVKNGTLHRDLGAAHFDHHSSEAKAKRLLAQLAKLGYQVQLQPATA